MNSPLGGKPGPILHLITDAGTEGNPHLYFRTLIQAGGLDPERVVVGCVGPPGPLQQDMQSLGVRTFALGARSRAGYPLAVSRLRALLWQLGASVAHTHLLDASLVGLTAARLARAPVAVMTAHHSHELPFHGRRVLWPEKLCTGPLSDHIVAPSSQVAQTLIDLARVPADKIEVIPHGFDLDRLNPAKADGANIRRELGLDGAIVFGAVGRLYRLKNYPALLEAFASALGTQTDARLVIVGPGERGPLESLARDLGVGDRVLLCGARTDIPDVLAAVDVFVHPAIAESFGMVIVEAMALARPVVSTPVGIAPDVVEDELTGVLCSGHDPQQLADGLRRMLSLRARWREMGQAARLRAQDFTAVAMAARYEELYARWLKEADFR